MLSTTLTRALKMPKDPLDHLGLFDAGNDPHCTTTALALFYVDPEHSFATSSPGHRAMRFAARRRRITGRPLAAPGRCHLGTQAAVGRDPPW